MGPVDSSFFLALTPSKFLKPFSASHRRSGKLLGSYVK
jgi:hypothetical protein